MKNLYLAQVNYRYGENAFLPYSVASIWAYCQQFKDIKEQYILKGFLWERTNPHWTAYDLDNPSVIGVSHYIWNAEWNKAFCKTVKRLFPDCLIIAGGPQIPDKESKITDESLCFDIMIHGEGEHAFVDALSGRLPNGHHSVSRILSLDNMPSPYLSGLFDDLMAAHPDIKWQATQETNRGCPYQCTFCDWGSATYSKVRKLPIDRINEEINWCSDNKIEMLYNADANFGMLERDLEIAFHIVERKSTHGYPKQFRAAYAKKTTDRVYEIGRLLSDSGMCKGVTLSMQSMDEGVQKRIKRSNIPMTQFAEVMKRYSDAKIPTYSEIILGLPGETIDSFMQGICDLLEMGQHDGLNIYPCMMLKNSELANETGIKTASVPMILNHAANNDDIVERYDLVIETDTMPYNDWLDCWLFGVMVQALHTLGAARLVVMDVKKYHHKSYYDIYEGIFYDSDSEDNWPVLSKSMNELLESATKVINGECLSWGTDIDGITFPVEEYLFIKIMNQYDDFLDELNSYCLMKYNCYDYLSQSIDYQKSRIKKPGDYENYARDVVWYGRKGGSMFA